MLRDDFTRRNPEQFESVRHQVFVLLAERFHSVDQRMQMHLSAHILELYREFLPSAHAYANFSSSLKPGEHKPFEQEDLPYLRAFEGVYSGFRLAVRTGRLCRLPGFAGGDCAHFPEGIFIVRDEKGYRWRSAQAYGACLELAIVGTICAWVHAGEVSSHRHRRRPIRYLCCYPR